MAIEAVRASARFVIPSENRGAENRGAMRGFLLAAVVMLFLGSVAHAQLPADNDAWKARCNTLRAAEEQIQNGKIAAELVAATRGVQGSKFLAFAFDRASANEHNVACVMYLMAAIADRNGNGGKVDISAAQDAELLAGVELKALHGDPLTFGERMKVMQTKVGQLIASSLSQKDADAVLVASSTVPISQGPKTVALRR